MAVWKGLRMEGSGAPPRPPSAPVLLVGVAVGLLVLLSLAVTGGGGVELGEPRVPVSLPGAAEGLADLSAVDGEAEPQPEPDQDGADTPWALIVIGLLATALAAVALRSLRPARPDQRRREQREAAPSESGATDVAQLTALRRAATRGRQQLEQAPPRRARDAVIAAWLELEDAAAAGGRPRRPAETPTEFTVALLRRHAADEAATRALLRLYHQARFGSTPLPPEAPAAATEALAAVSASLARTGA